MATPPVQKLPLTNERIGFAAKFDDGNLEVGVRFADVTKKKKTKPKGFTYVKAKGQLGKDLQEVIVCVGMAIRQAFTFYNTACERCCSQSRSKDRESK